MCKRTLATIDVANDFKGDKKPDNLSYLAISYIQNSTYLRLTYAVKSVDINLGDFIYAA